VDVLLAPQRQDLPVAHALFLFGVPLLLKHAPFANGVDRARLYLLDLPRGSARVLAIAIMSDEDSFERALGLAAPTVDSIQFHAP
jgi:hypothetical protein